jgi:hypothetical protein
MHPVAERRRVHATPGIGEYVAVFGRSAARRLVDYFRVLDIWTADSRVEPAADNKHCVTERFRVEPASVHSPQKAVFGIDGCCSRILSGAHPIGPRQNDLANEPLRRPTLLNEPRRQVVEQLRMRGKFAGSTEIVQRSHEPRAEQIMPHPVYIHPRRKRIARRYNPFRQFAPAALIGRHLGLAANGRHAQHAARYDGPPMMNAPTNADTAVFYGRGFMHRHRLRDLRAALSELRQPLLEPSHFRFLRVLLLCLLQHAFGIGDGIAVGVQRGLIFVAE